ncbi:nuclear localization sequence binding protein, partial [Coemansia helicoidea]
MEVDSDSGKRKASSDEEMDSDSESEKEVKKPEGKKQKTEEEEQQFTIFVGNLPFTATRESLMEVFGEYGTVLGARIATHQDSGKSRGFGYVDFAADAGRAKALAADYVELDGRQLRMEAAESKSRGERPARATGGGAPSGNEPSKTLFIGNLS